jgi:two-component system response regulator PhoP
MRTLVVEDDTALRESLKQQLVSIGYVVDVAAHGDEALFAGLNYAVDAAIVDIGLPNRTGLELTREWRAQGRTFPIIMLTARNDWRDGVEGFNAGADDYMGKPFSFEELVIRLQALLRRFNGWMTQEIVCGPFVLNMRAQRVSVDGVIVDLTNYEYRLLEYFMMKAGETISGTELAAHMYEEAIERESNIVAQLVCRLRQKLDPGNRMRPIETVYGGGYRFAIGRGVGGEATDVRRLKRRA